MSKHTVYVEHDFEIKYREYHVKDAAVKTAVVRATSQVQAKVRWKYDERSQGNMLVSVTRIT